MMQKQTLAKPYPDTDYTVMVTRRGGDYELRIWELRLVVRGPDLDRAYRELLKRKQQVIDWASEVGSLDELPLPRQRPLA